MSPECSSPEMPVPSGDPRPALPLSPPGGAGSGKPREAEPGRDFPGTAAGARRPGWGWDGGKRGVLGAPGGRAERRRQWENASQGKGFPAVQGCKVPVLGLPVPREGPGLAGPSGPSKRPPGDGDVGKIRAGESCCLGGVRRQQDPALALTPFFPRRWGSSVFSVLPVGSAPSRSSPSLALEPCLPWSGAGWLPAGRSVPQGSRELQHGTGTAGRGETAETERLQTQGGVL